MESKYLRVFRRYRYLTLPMVIHYDGMISGRKRDRSNQGLSVMTETSSWWWTYHLTQVLVLALVLGPIVAVSLRWGSVALGYIFVCSLLVLTQS